MFLLIADRFRGSPEKIRVVRDLTADKEVLRLYVEDADATFQRALDAGGIAVTNVTHLFWGDRIGRVRDPMGNLWWIQARVEDVDEAEINRRMSDPVWLERMAYVQSVDPFAKDAQ